MAFRTDSNEVCALIDVKSGRDVEPFIESANLIVDENLVGKGLTDKRLKLIELYLSAHLVAVTEERGALVEKEFGDSREEYEIIVGEGFAMTRFGQQAISFDTSGTLADIGTTTSVKTAQFRVI